MAILPIVSVVPLEVTLNQACYTPSDQVNIPPECRLYQRSLEDVSAKRREDERRGPEGHG